jgi:protein-tyrosine phosphatase
MTDIHCHVLDGVDDGPTSAEEALAMLRMACEDCVGAVIATPHYNGRYNADPARIAERASFMSGRLEREGLDLRLYTGNECFLDENMLPALLSGRCLTLARSRYVLTEVSSFLSDSMLKRMLTDILQSGYIPVIAHCERLVLSRRDTAKIDGLRDMGCLLQVNAGTLLENERGWFGQWVFGKIADGTVSFVASDAHGAVHRSPALRAAYDKAARLLGAGAADAVFSLNAETLLNKAGAGLT